jgi:1-aminocyclopropane-1-carboxylate deaminase/D-cysteine desulfhydrase-like pyridoxal-dependent ACC family enzyme
MEQCANLPPDVKRVVVPTGSGLTAAGVLAGLALARKRPLVIAIAVSRLADEQKIMKLAAETVGLSTGKLFNHYLPNFCLKYASSKYGQAVEGYLPDGTPLDPYYAAKALPYVQPGDCLWLPGLRPLSAMPEPMRSYKWEGFK